MEAENKLSNNSVDITQLIPFLPPPPSFKRMNREARKLPRNLSRGKRITSTELIRHFEELFSDLESEGQERERERERVEWNLRD